MYTTREHRAVLLIKCKTSTAKPTDLNAYETMINYVDLCCRNFHTKEQLCRNMRTIDGSNHLEPSVYTTTILATGITHLKYQCHLLSASDEGKMTFESGLNLFS